MSQQHPGKSTENGNAITVSGAEISREANAVEVACAEGRYTVECIGPREEFRDEYVKLRDEMEAFVEAGEEIEAARIKSLMTPMEEQKWIDVIDNIVATIGKNLALDTYLAGSGYTVVGPYLGLISSVSYTAVAAADTMTSHAGWTEAGITNAPTYSAGRKTAAWSAAAAGAKALSAALSFAMTGAGTVKGAFMVFGTGAVSTVDSTAGTLYSAGLFSGGDKVVANADTLNVSYSTSL